MLLEKQRIPSNRPIAIGETVKVIPTGQTGIVEGYDSGQWIVNVNGSKVLVLESQLQVREVLYG